MKISYVGRRNEEWAGKPSRCADITVNEDNDKEVERLEKMAQLLRIKGWTVDDVSYGWVMIWVEDYKEYEDMVADYKVAKTMLKGV